MKNPFNADYPIPVEKKLSSLEEGFIYFLLLNDVYSICFGSEARLFMLKGFALRENLCLLFITSDESKIENPFEDGVKRLYLL